MSNKKSVLIINRTPPYGSSYARESLDIALTCSIFEMPVSLLFLSDGIFQLVKGQDPSGIEQKNLQSVLSSLPMYDIENIYVEQEALNSWALTTEELCLDSTVINNDEIQSLIASHDTVLTF